LLYLPGPDGLGSLHLEPARASSKKAIEELGFKL
jgi:hypothetical protein